MKIKLSPIQSDIPPPVYRVIDENTLRIDGNDYTFPEDIEEFDPVGPILEASRNAQGKLKVTLLFPYHRKDKKRFETRDSEGKYRGEDFETFGVGVIE
jgi:hypothetical protein